MTAISALWRRLDTPGHDACLLVCDDTGWQLHGTAVFLHGSVPARIDYRVAGTPSWITRHGEVRGWLGERPVEARVERSSSGQWSLDGARVAGLSGCVDLDLGFTPATNLQQLRRIALAPGEAAEVPVAWFDLGAATLEELPQRYRRRSAATYWYEAPSVGYRALLEVGTSGFVRRYPGLWVAVSDQVS